MIFQLIQKLMVAFIMIKELNFELEMKHLSLEADHGFPNLFKYNCHFALIFTLEIIGTFNQ